MKEVKSIFILFFILFSLVGCTDKRTELELSINPSAYEGTPYFTIETNLPDGFTFNVSVEQMDFVNMCWSYAKNETVVVKDGVATTGIYSNGRKSLDGKYTVSISGYCKDQEDFVKEIIGEKFCNYKDTDKRINENEYLDGDGFYVRDSIDVEIKKIENVNYDSSKEFAISDSTKVAYSENAKKESTKIENSVEKYVLNYTASEITDININEHAGTKDTDDYIVLIYIDFTLDHVSSDDASELIKMYSDDIAANLYNDHKSVQEVCVFWRVPSINNDTSKFAYERKQDGMYLTNKILSI